MKIWVDDLRPAPDGWFWATSSESALAVLRYFLGYRNDVQALSLDHDLGGDDTTRPVVLWMAENNVWPDKVYVHTANPVGREWLVGMINRYGPGVAK